MSRIRELPPIGSVVEVIQGRDAGLVAIVVGHIEGSFVLVADGSIRRSDRPKKKNLLHIRSLRYVAHDIASKLSHGEHVGNAQLRYAVRTFVEERLGKAQVGSEGGASFGER